jgi:hypothetical protein
MDLNFVKYIQIEIIELHAKLKLMNTLAIIIAIIQLQCILGYLRGKSTVLLGCFRAALI